MNDDRALHALDALLAPAELSARLSVDETYLDWLRVRHGLPYIRIGGQVRFRPSDIDAWLARRSVGGEGGGA